MHSLLIFVLMWNFCVKGSEQCKDIRLQQSLLNEGYHRKIIYKMSFANNENDSFSYKDCIVSLNQKLPRGVFVNSDELDELKHIGKVHALIKTRVDVEATAEQASSINLHIIGKVAGDDLTLWLPVHARYHKAVSGGGVAENYIEAPKLYLKCPDNRVDICEGTLVTENSLCNGTEYNRCKWKEMSYTLTSPSLKWSVPIGNTDHCALVTVVSMSVIFLASVYLLKTLHTYNVRTKKKWS